MKYNKKIVITADEKETLARLFEGGKVVKSATAKCSPEDEFDFATGARLAFDRLLGEEKHTIKWKVVYRHARVGDYIRLKGINFSFNREGDILKVAEAHSVYVSVKSSDHPRNTGMHDGYLWHYSGSSYEVVVPCTAEEEYYKGKAVCIKENKGDLTVGKVYDFSENDGLGRNDRGTNILNYPRKSFADIKASVLGEHFIQLIEEED
jgi:hypothetical protein